ncbi:MAG TPA: ferritin [Actinomycetota bacterium]|nr:ferritin [Actinomycetota bacterium]
MLSAELGSAMNRQVAAELYSSHLYLAMSAYCEAQNLPGFARWFRVQADEERDHALRFFAHVVDRGGRVALEAIEAPPEDFGSPLGAFERALAHERDVTGMIDALYATAVKETDYASQVFLQWFVQEQVEEEKQASEIVQVLSSLGDQPAGLLMLDRELGARRSEG